MPAGIVSYGAYVPPTRLALAAIAGRPGKEGGPEKAVAWNDEDAVTMAVDGQATGVTRERMRRTKGASTGGEASGADD